MEEEKRLRAKNLADVSPFLQKSEVSFSADMVQENEYAKGYKIERVSVEQLDRGYIVKVGCKSFAIASREELLEKLTEYIKNPFVTQRKYEEGKFF